jgi:uncharacterized membrane protein YhhN
LDLTFIANLFLFIAFLYASIGTLLSYGLEKNKWLFFTKPFIIPVLVLYYVLNSHDPLPVIIVAMLFAFLGDFFLMWPNKKVFFMLGLLCFFLMLVFYIVFMLTYQVRIAGIGIESVAIGFAYLLLGALIFALLYRYLESFKIPVIFYILALLSVSYICFFSVMEHKTEAAFVQYIGSLLFIISDTILAIDSFRKTIRYGGIYIMLTYTIAQIFLLAGFMNTIKI